MTHHYSFKDCLQRAERIAWRVEDLIGEGKTLDFTLPFLPESLARTTGLDFLSSSEKRLLNHIRGHAYLAIFGLVEEFILPFVLDHARPLVTGDGYRARALLEFASEEAKHIQLFRLFREDFLSQFHIRCEIIGPPDDIARHVLSHHPLSVALLTLHIEWMTQRHFQDSVRNDDSLDPQFKNLLLHHWMEEHQHAQLDTLMVQAISTDMTQAEKDAAIDGYFTLGAFLDAGMRQQTEFDMDAFERAAGRTLDEEQRELFCTQQHQANRWTYIGSGMSHPKFLETLAELSAEKHEVALAAAPQFC